jgi:hypothetical protein
MASCARVALFSCLVLMIGAVPATAQSLTDSATLNASINSQARLSLSTLSISFPDADPDTVPSVQGAPAAVTITAKARTSSNGAVTLTVRATDHLRSGLDTIPASQITWTAAGAGFSGGTLSATTAQIVAAWTGSGVHTGTQTFFFKNLWTYAAGIYTLTMTFTLTAA